MLLRERASVRRLGVQYQPGSSTFTADCGGVAVHVGTSKSGTGDYRGVLTHFRVAAAQRSLELQVFGRSAVNLADALLRDKTPIGDPAFDAEWVVQSNDAAAVQRALQPELRTPTNALRDVHPGRYTFSLSQGTAEVIHDGTLRYTDPLVAAAHAVAAFARATYSA